MLAGSRRVDSNATAAPGDRDYNGGPWIVQAVSFTTSYAAAAYGGANGVLDNDAEVLAAISRR